MLGSTIALASISGPIEVRLAVEQASKATFEVSVRPLIGVPGLLQFMSLNGKQIKYASDRN